MFDWSLLTCCRCQPVFQVDLTFLPSTRLSVFVTVDRVDSDSFNYICGLRQLQKLLYIVGLAVYCCMLRMVGINGIFLELVID